MVTYLINVSPFTNICVNFHTMVTKTFEIKFFFFISVDLKINFGKKNHQTFETIKLKKENPWSLIRILFHWAFIITQSIILLDDAQRHFGGMLCYACFGLAIRTHSSFNKGRATWVGQVKSNCSWEGKKQTQNKSSCKLIPYQIKFPRNQLHFISRIGKILENISSTELEILSTFDPHYCHS